MKTTVYISPLGRILLAAEDGALTGLWFAGQKYEGRGLPESCVSVSPDREEILAAAAEWLDSFFAGEIPELNFSLRPKGTPFQLRVWKALTEIPYGKTVSYGQLAEKLGCRSARAVGSAVGKNPISLIIPCHRVIGADGSLTGYAGGIDRKKQLLALEQTQRALHVS